MKTPKTPIEFDYDIWTTEDGKCMVRVKRTGEVSEVDRKVMRILRAEEKRIRRSYGSDNSSEDEDGAEKISDTVLSLDAMPEDDVKSAAWLADSRDCMEELITALKEKELLSILTEKIRRARVAISQQKPRYLKCPYCQHNAIAVYEDTRGHVESKCKKCGRITVFDVLNMRRLRPRTK